MYRCKGITQVGRRCKRRIGEKDGYCPVHNDLPGMPTEVDNLKIIENIDCFKDDDPSQRSCGHCCAMTLDRCCECTDQRHSDAVPQDMRAHGYCSKCKVRFNTRLPPPSPRLVWHNFVIDAADHRAIIEQLLVHVFRR
jgi:hypothetical protein